MILGNGKTNKKRVNELEKSEKDEIFQKIATIQAILERIPRVLYHGVKTGEGMHNVDSVLNSNHYQPVTMDDENILNMALEYNVINRQSLSKRISQAYVDVQHSINIDEVGSLDKLSESTQTQQGYPVNVLEDMLSI